MATTPDPAHDGAPSRDNARPGVVTAAVAVTLCARTGEHDRGPRPHPRCDRDGHETGLPLRFPIRRAAPRRDHDRLLGRVMPLGGARSRARRTTCVGPRAERHDPAAPRRCTAHSPRGPWSRQCGPPGRGPRDSEPDRPVGSAASTRDIHTFGCSGAAAFGCSGAAVRQVWSNAESVLARAMRGVQGSLLRISAGQCSALTGPTDDHKAAAQRRRLNERLRAEYIAGAEEEWRKRTGRPMTAEELERVLRRYPGDV